MQDSVFAPHYAEEHLQQVVDSYNLLYVACTRPKKNLFILKGAGKQDEKKKPNTTGSLNTIAQLIELAIPTEENEYIDFGLLESIEATPNNSTHEDLNPNPFEVQPSSIAVTMCSNPLTVNFRQSNLSKRFVASGTTPTESYLDRGLLLHELFSRMNTAADAAAAINELTAQGLIVDETLQREITRIVNRALEHPQAADWFSGKYELFNECSIIYTPGTMPTDSLCYAPDMQPHTLRPDRVMRHEEQIIVVDFKFARPSEEHKKQVARYMELLHHMGHSHVEGYVWYGYENRIIKVESLKR
jgi:ATP-dependent exoDNAse (exonuclease V) beta subunit